MIAQQMTSNGIILPKKTAHAHDDVISFDVIVRRIISKLCPPCQLVPTTPLSGLLTLCDGYTSSIFSHDLYSKNISAGNRVFGSSLLVTQILLNYLKASIRSIYFDVIFSDQWDLFL